MYPVSQGFIDALKSTNVRIDRRVTASDGTVLSISGGSVNMDSRRGITRTCDLDILPDATRSADDLFLLLMQPTLEVLVEYGVWVNGAFEYVPLGLFSTDTASVDKNVAGSVKWSGSDRSKKISRAKFVDPYQISRNTTLATAAGRLLESRYSGVDYDFSNVIEKIRSKVVLEAGESSNPWDSLRELFASNGYDANFNGNGVCRAVEIPDPADLDPIFDFGSGSTQLVTGGSSQGSLEGVYNGVIATGEGSEIEPPVRAEVWDTNPSSPTFYLGGFGKVPFFYTSSQLTTDSECSRAARAKLAKLKGRMQQLSWPSVTNPALEPLDVVSVTFGSTTSVVVLDSLTIPLGADSAMSAIARETVLA